MGLPPDAQQSTGSTSRFGELAPIADSLAAFKNGVDLALSDLGKSPASNSNISRQDIARSSYGTVPDAKDLADAYETVHNTLKDLSQILGDQLEALGITVDMANRGYQVVDEEHRNRLHVLQAQMQQYYAKHTKGGDAGQPHTKPGDTGSGGSSSGSATGY
ncbi:hypothetical protein ACWGCW_22340 [Streptomyces sp. NPDC054933]